MEQGQGVTPFPFPAILMGDSSEQPFCRQDRPFPSPAGVGQCLRRSLGLGPGERALPVPCRSGGPPARGPGTEGRGLLPPRPGERGAGRGRRGAGSGEAERERAAAPSSPAGRAGRAGPGRGGAGSGAGRERWSLSWVLNLLPLPLAGAGERLRAAKDGRSAWIEGWRRRAGERDSRLRWARHDGGARLRPPAAAAAAAAGPRCRPAQPVSLCRSRRRGADR